MSSARLLILGAAGQLGQSLVRQRGWPLDSPQVRPAVLGLSRTEAPLDDADLLLKGLRVAVADFQPTHLVNAAAYTAVDKAETDEGRAAAEAVNARAPGLIGEFAKPHGLPVVHFSTDYVFDGSLPHPQAYPHDWPVAPASVYGQTKAAGEQALLQSGAACLVLRTSWVYSAHGANFFNTMIRLALSRPELRVVGDQIGAPTSAEWLAAMTHQLCEAWPTGSGDDRGGIHHLTASGSVSWHGFARALLARTRAARPDLNWQIRADDQVQEIPSRDYPTPARRPENSRLSGEALRAAFPELQLDCPWEEQLHEVVREWAAQFY